MDTKATHPPPVTPVLPYVLDYAAPTPKQVPRWINPRLTPEAAILLWTVSSYAYGALDSPYRGWPHFFVGLTLYVYVRLARWKAALPWKTSAAVGVTLLVIGLHVFLEPWAAENWRLRYWYTYNQTYFRNYDASLRVWWAPGIGRVWLVATLATRWVRRKNQSRRMRVSSPLPPAGEG